MFLHYKLYGFINLDLLVNQDCTLTFKEGDIITDLYYYDWIDYCLFTNECTYKEMHVQRNAHCSTLFVRGPTWHPVALNGST